MNTALLFESPESFASPLLTVFAVDAAAGKDDPAPILLTADHAILDAAAPILASGEFKAALAETLLLHHPAGLAADRLLVIGLGKAGLGKASALTADALRKAAGAAVRFAKPRGLRDVALLAPEFPGSVPEVPAGLATRSLAEGALLADFDIDFYRSDRKDQSVSSVTILSSETNPEFQHWSRIGLEQGIAYGQSQNFARTLVNEPGNVLTPTELGRRAAAMAAEVGLSCEVHGMDKLLELKMGAFAAVAKGSEEPPALIVLRYEPTEHGQPAPATGPNGEPAPVLGLVGKGITFDTGGISLKPGDNMDKMKYDMAGAAAMLGAMRAIALLKPAVRVLCVVCSAENMPDGRAYKPGDVLTAMSGKTIEVLNTDAEGRLVLADGLHYAQTLGATHLINACTLTGAIGIALGLLNTGLFSNDDATTQRFLDVLPSTGEKYWRMPCTDDYKDTIKSQIADIMNTGGSRYGGAISGAMFLKEFVGSTPWIHLDIAGTAWSDEQKPWHSKGPTGVAVRSIAEWARTYGE